MLRFVFCQYFEPSPPTNQIGVTPAKHLRVAAEFPERMVNMGIKGIKDHLITMVNMGIKDIEDNLITRVNMAIKDIEDHLVTLAGARAGNKVPLSTCFFKI